MNWLARQTRDPWFWVALVVLYPVLVVMAAWHVTRELVARWQERVL